MLTIMQPPRVSTWQLYPCYPPLFADSSVWYKLWDWSVNAMCKCNLDDGMFTWPVDHAAGQLAVMQQCVWLGATKIRTFRHISGVQAFITSFFLSATMSRKVHKLRCLLCTSGLLCG